MTPGRPNMGVKSLLNKELVFSVRPGVTGIQEVMRANIVEFVIDFKVRNFNKDIFFVLRCLNLTSDACDPGPDTRFYV